MSTVVEYAASGRAACKACGLKIEHLSLRVGTELQGDWCAADESMNRCTRARA
jgi:hypothetical protein